MITPSHPFNVPGCRLLRADSKWLEPLLACLLICLQARAERRATIPQGKETLLLCMSCYQLRQAMQSVHKPWDRGCRNITLAPFPQLNFMFLFKFPCDLRNSEPTGCKAGAGTLTVPWKSMGTDRQALWMMMPGWQIAIPSLVPTSADIHPFLTPCIMLPVCKAGEVYGFEGIRMSSERVSKP